MVPQWQIFRPVRRFPPPLVDDEEEDLVSDDELESELAESEEEPELETSTMDDFELYRRWP